ncbi:MAG: hypothetical protein NXI24_09390 [bacterium]|nr:hypothetical protein [bacterium]
MVRAGFLGFLICSVGFTLTGAVYSEYPGSGRVEESELQGLWDCRSPGHASYLVIDSRSRYEAEYFRDPESGRLIGKRRFGLLADVYYAGTTQLQFSSDEVATFRPSPSGSSKREIYMYFKEGPPISCALLAPGKKATQAALDAIVLDRIALHFETQRLVGRWRCRSDSGNFVFVFGAGGQSVTSYRPDDSYSGAGVKYLDIRGKLFQLSFPMWQRSRWRLIEDGAKPVLERTYDDARCVRE